MKSFDILQVVEALLTDRHRNRCMSLLSFLVYIRVIDCLKGLPRLFHHFTQILDVLLYFLNGCLGWLVGIGGCDDTEFLPKLKASILQSGYDFVGFFSKDWQMSAILVFAVVFLTIINRVSQIVESA
jgi:hypothetical protein